MDTHDQEPDKSESEILLEKSHTSAKKFSLAAAMREAGLFLILREPDKNLSKKRKDIERQPHLKKTLSPPSLGGLQTPREAFSVRQGNKAAVQHSR